MELSEINFDDGEHLMIFVFSTSSIQLVELLDDVFNFELCLRKLSLSEQIAIRSIKYKPKKALILRIMAKYILNSLLAFEEGEKNCDPWRHLEYSYNEYGKPELASINGARIQFNSSSSDDLAAMAIQFGGNSNSPVGIDLSHESQDSISPEAFMSQFEGIFSAKETIFLKNIEDIELRYRKFNQLWTLKEAFTKFLGVGLNMDLASFSFTLLPIHPKEPFPTETSNFRQENSNLKQESSSSKQDQSCLSLLWDYDIDVDTSQLHRTLKQKLKRNATKCWSTILKDTSETSVEKTLPVFMSVVHQMEKRNCRCIEIDTVAVINHIIK